MLLPNVIAGIEVSIEAVTALAAKEERLRTTIIAGLIATTGTGLGSMSGVNLDYSDTPCLGFVLDKGVQLGKAPTMQTPLTVALLTVFFTSPQLGSIPNVLEVFKDNGTARGGMLHDALGEDVIVVFAPPKLFAAQLLEVSLCRANLYATVHTPLTVAYKSDILPLQNIGGRNMKDKLKDKEEEVLSLWDSGLNVKEIATRYDVMPGSLRTFLNKHQRDTSRKIVMTIPTLEVKDAAYIAGIIDGEGCICIRSVTSRGCSYFQSRLIIGTSSSSLAEYLTRVTGTGFRRTHSHAQKANWKPMFRWELGSLQATELLKQVLPYLQIKRVQAELFIELTELKLKSKPGYRFAEERQLEIVERIQKLNQRGIIVDGAV